MDTRPPRSEPVPPAGTPPTGTPPTPVRHLRDLDIRRALLAVLVDARRPLTIAEIVARLRWDHGVVLDRRQKVSAGQRVADMARYQARLGRVRRVGRGRYIGVPAGMSRSMRWRSRNWKLLHDRDRPHAVPDCTDFDGAA